MGAPEPARRSAEPHLPGSGDRVPGYEMRPRRSSERRRRQVVRSQPVSMPPFRSRSEVKLCARLLGPRVRAPAGRRRLSSTKGIFLFAILGDVVKKLLLLALAIIGGLLVYRQVQSGKAEQDLWAEATDPVKP